MNALVIAGIILIVAGFIGAFSLTISVFGVPIFGTVALGIVFILVGARPHKKAKRA